MNVQEAYNNWAGQYDSNENKTRDLEAFSLRETLSPLDFQYCLEIGCGTGKNTAWLLEKAAKVKAVDLSNEMLSKARNKIQSAKVEFIQADITEDWRFADGKQFDLATFSLVLEHIENLDSIFQKLKVVIQEGGYVYIGELHPFKQYSGSKARFETEAGVQIVTCYNHHISDFTTCAHENGFKILAVKEYFDDNERTNIPRILTLLLQKH
jgi:ubiquinone/menaquinone biosynthesis C-methylase UbiE